MKNKDGSVVVVEPELAKKERKKCMERLMNVENTWVGRMEADVIEGLIKCITKMEVENALSAMKSGKAPAPNRCFK